MAQLVQDTITITFSRVAKDNEELQVMADAVPELLATLESVAQELVGKGVIVEVR